MEPENDKTDIAEELKTRFLQLPKVLREAITSADVEKRLRELAESHKLHIDQGQKLENEVMLALFGFQKVENLEENLKKEVGISAEIANVLAGDIAESIFQPIREELEKELADKPGAGSQEPVASDQRPVAGSQQPAANDLNPVSPSPATSYGLPATSSSVLPSTPPPPPNTEKSIRAPASSAYTSQAPSHERSAVEGDPYRESTA